MAPAQTLNSILEDVKSLEPLPQVALRVMAISQQGDLVPGDLVGVIQTDAGLTGKVLKLANSAYYGFRREIASLAEAGNLLGTNKLVNLVLTSCTARYFRRYGAQEGGAGERLWERSLSTALTAGLIARPRGNLERERAYTAGLLENVGHLVLARFLPDAEVELASALAAGVSRLDAEESVLGIHHAEIGARLAERWDFPPVLVDTIRHHHDPSEAEIDVLLASCAHLGEVISQRLEERAGHATPAYELSGSALLLTGVAAQELDTLEDSVRAELERARDLVDLG
jgi:HD-like signal output (HDOD) protein